MIPARLMLLILCHRRLLLQTSPQAKVVRAASSKPDAHPVSGEGSVDSEQPAQAIGQQGGRVAGPQLHDSAASGSSSDADQVNNVAEFLTRKDTANINEASQISPDAGLAASGEAERATAQMAPFEARKTFLLGPPKPACCPERSRTAEGINKLRWADDPDIGDHPLCFLCCMSVSCLTTNPSISDSGKLSKPVTGLLLLSEANPLVAAARSYMFSSSPQPTCAMSLILTVHYVLLYGSRQKHRTALSAYGQVT